jgi:hypothetical protein
MLVSFLHFIADFSAAHAAALQLVQKTPMIAGTSLLPSSCVVLVM